MKVKILLFFAVCFLLTACKNNDIYFEYYTVNPQGWNKDSIYVFDVVIEDTVSAYNVYVNVRNTPEYTNQNLWLFMENENPDGIVTKDTIELYLANGRGQWLGSGAGAIKEMPVLYLQNNYFDKSGVYRYSIGHGMRYDELKGINDIGLRVEKLN